MESVKFDKSFEALYKSAMAMADNCIPNKDMDKRFEKLAEEYAELLEIRDQCRGVKPVSEDASILDGGLHGEFADVLFVLLHIAHIKGWTAFDLLHAATSKMLYRMNDPNYIAKN